MSVSQQVQSRRLHVNSSSMHRHLVTSSHVPLPMLCFSFPVRELNSRVWVVRCTSIDSIRIVTTSHTHTKVTIRTLEIIYVIGSNISHHAFKKNKTIANEKQVRNVRHVQNDTRSMLQCCRQIALKRKQKDLAERNHLSRYNLRRAPHFTTCALLCGVRICNDAY